MLTSGVVLVGGVEQSGSGYKAEHLTSREEMIVLYSLVVSSSPNNWAVAEREGVQHLERVNGIVLTGRITVAGGPCGWTASESS